ncbi:hypothetical protein CWI38_0515p0040 [Hamiltosporidium tvaerminnensis]|uniref:Uncharacterized protein n=1 Tax=Hamiltosporidium tvaerminnensis TaxID=1176355 RepID=A0A4Q9LWU6_9MICR|nr:hypothetical protein CWI38_0515p0040 [Hamiltosporidium tvaerminnensis]
MGVSDMVLVTSLFNIGGVSYIHLMYGVSDRGIDIVLLYNRVLITLLFYKRTQ